MQILSDLFLQIAAFFANIQEKMLGVQKKEGLHSGKN